jgi:hypothetical protein
MAAEEEDRCFYASLPREGAIPALLSNVMESGELVNGPGKREFRGFEQLAPWVLFALQSMPRHR